VKNKKRKRSVEYLEKRFPNKKGLTLIKDSVRISLPILFLKYNLRQPYFIPHNTQESNGPSTKLWAKNKRQILEHWAHKKNKDE
jgi:hypothetical protein